MTQPPADARGAAWGAARQSALIAALAATVASACAPRMLVPPPVAIPPAFSATGARALAVPWWRELDDPTLDALVAQGLAENLDLRTVWDRLAQAEATARREGAALVPSIDATAGGSRTEITTSAAQASGAGGRNAFTLGIGASYELDLWGRVRSLHDAARLDVVATTYDIQTAAITLAAEIATTWYELVEQSLQLAILDRQIDVNDRVLELVTLRFRKGQVGAADVLRQRQLLESTRGGRPEVAARLAVLRHQLAVLIGRSPGTLELAPPLAAEQAYAVLPPLPATGLPSTLIERRPDVRAAFFRVLAADRQVNAAVADRLPRLAISGSTSLSSQELRDLLDNWIATMSASLVAPLIDGGRRRAEVERTRAIVSERLHAYGQAILVAFREVEDALAQEEQQRRLIASLARQLEISNGVLERIRDQYIHGTIVYLDVLQALVTHQTLERERVSAERRLLELRIGLYRALAGGWTLERPALASIGGGEA
jgi:NodT family efflux transporter outer membrane factor (OMF) lipoprotein